MSTNILPADQLGMLVSVSSSICVLNATSEQIQKLEYLLGGKIT